MNFLSGKISINIKQRQKIIMVLIGLFSILTPGLSQELFPSPGQVFRDDVVPRIDILLPQDSLDVMLAPGNEESDYHWHATFIFDNGTIRDTFENVGFRLRGNTSRYSDKKSYKISFNTYEPGRKFYGLEKLNLNGEHNDPSIMRAKTCWDLVRNMEIPGSRSNHINLYVNDQYFGVYLNVEHIDEEFVDLRYGNNYGNLYKCLWPADMNFLGDDPDLYKFMSGGRRAYDLITNTEADDYSDIAHLIDVLNNTSAANLPCELEPIFNVEFFLRAMAFDVLSANWDGPLFNKNNFYLYNDPVSGKFHYIPYDVDNTFGIDWFGVDWANRDIYNWANQNEERPLYWNILAVSEYRDLFTYYINEFLDYPFAQSVLFEKIDQLKSQIDPFIPDDPFYPLDYGFSVDDFNDSYVEALPYNHTDYGLKPFITTRNSSANAQKDNSIKPVIVYASNNFPAIDEDIVINVKVVGTNPVSEVEVCYQFDSGDFNCLPLFDDGQHEDGAANDHIFGGFIPAINQMATVNYYIIAKDVTQLEREYPSCEFKQVLVGHPEIPIFINEIMADNENTLADEAGEYDDWIELYYTGSAPLFLGDKFLSDDESNPTKWKFNDSWIYPNQFKVVWLDKDEEQGLFHANFKLSAGGEFIGIFNNVDFGHSLINGIHFGEQTADVAYARIPNGTGDFVFQDATPAASNTPTSVEENSLNDNLIIKPNPFSDYLKFGVTDSHQQDIQWQLTDVSGKIIFEGKQNASSGLVQLNTSSLQAGVYFLTIGKKGRKVVLMR